MSLSKRIYLGCGFHELDGWVNLDIDPSLGKNIIKWSWGQPLPFADGEVDLVLIQHSLVFCRKEDMPKVFRDIARVTKVGGCLVIKEEDSRRYTWHKIGHHVRRKEGGIIASITPVDDVIALMESVGYAISKGNVKRKYRQYLNRKNRIGRQFYAIEGVLISKPAV